MKILYFIDHLRPEGTQRVLRQLVQGLSVRGHEQTVVCLNNSWDQNLIDDLRAHVRIHVVGKLHLITGIGLFSTFQLLRGGQFDVVVTLLFASDVIGRCLGHLANGPRIVSSIRARNINYVFWQRIMVRSTMRWADTVVLNSGAVRDFAVTVEGAPTDRICVIPNGVNVKDYATPVDRLALHAEFGIAPDQLLLGGFGRLTHQKGFDVLLHAFAQFGRRDVDLMLVGTGEEEATLRALASTLGLTRRVHFTGYRRDVPRLLGALDLFVHVPRFEGMPNVLLEAMAAGCPIVASAVDGNCELIVDQQHGWLVPSENVMALSRAINTALDDREEAQRRGAAAQARAATEFSVDAMIDAWEQVLMGKHQQ